MSHAIAPAGSITHQHLAAVVSTMTRQRLRDSIWKPGNVVRVLDAGCGSGNMMSFLAVNLPVLVPEVTWEIYGYDLSDHGVQVEGYFRDTMDMLARNVPSVKWEERLRLLHDGEPWPFPDQFFAFVLSNQVGEHVHDFDAFLHEMHRTMAPRGFGVHLFPVSEVLFEGHILLPILHWFEDADLRRAYVRLMMRLGYSFLQDGGPFEWTTQSHADYSLHHTFYRPTREVMRSTKKHNFRASWRFTREFYVAKLRSIAKRTPNYEYDTERSALFDWLSFRVLRRVSGVTLFLERRNEYRRKQEWREMEELS